MSYDAKVLEIMIASPGDVVEERQIAREVITEWNVVNSRQRGVILSSVGWDTHSSPELGHRPQQIINDRVLSHADILVGIFWTRIGSPTGKAISGSIEEVDEHRNKGRPVMLYFSDAPVEPSRLDRDQYDRLQEFRNWAKSEGLIEFFRTRQEFKEKFARQFSLELWQNNYIRELLKTRREANSEMRAPPLAPALPSLAPDPQELLLAMASDPQGAVLVLRHLTGTTIQAGDRSFGDPNSRRSIAQWEAAIRELQQQGMIVDPDGRGEMFQVTDRGYRFLEERT